METESKDRHGHLMPAMAALVVAVLGTAGLAYQDFGPANGSQVSSDANMITAAAVSKAGAIQIPSQPRAGQSAS
jgi:hypothetical protein